MKRIACVLTCLAIAFASAASPTWAQSAPAGTGDTFKPAQTLECQDVWVHAGETSAVIAWRLNDISQEALGYVEYGPTAELGQKTAPADATRWIQIHRISGLEPGKTYHYRPVIVQGEKKTPGKAGTFKAGAPAGAVRIAVSADGKASGQGVSSGGAHKAAMVLDKPDTTYVLTGDVQADGTAIVIAAKGVTLDLDGHTVTYARNSDKQVFGVVPDAPDAKVYNGRIVQGDSGGEFCYSFAGRRKVNGLEAAGLYCEAKGFNAYPFGLFGAADGKIAIHHNELYSTVQKIQSRHYPGNDILRLDPSAGAEVDVHDNLLTEGCHRAIAFMGKEEAKSIRIHHNDIRHHMRFTNGYAFNGNLAGGKIYRNRITSIGRTAHLTAPRIEYYENWASTKGHMERGDMPQGSGKWQEIRVELHGIKFEGKNATQIRVHHNFMQCTQPQPDNQWDWVAVTPLNLGAADPNAMNEIHNNTFVAHTTYKKTRPGPYGKTGNWAAAVWLVNEAPKSDEGKYYAYLHDNEFISNDIMLGTSSKVSPELGLRVEKNIFKLGENPTEKPSVFHRIPPELQQRIQAGQNTFVGIKP